MPELPRRLGKYNILSILGQGAMGVVYKGMDPDIERPVAIKVMHPHLRDSTGSGALQLRFRREAMAGARCVHPNIVTVFDFGSDQGRDFIVMEFVEGKELKSFLNQGHEFSQAESVYMIVEVLKALDAAHRQGVVHRDIKPGNIILLSSGGVKVADFGVARIDRSDLTVTGHLFGTPVYMCPEGLRAEAVDHRADIYSTGMVLLELLTGEKPLPQQVLTRPLVDFLDQAFQGTRGSRVGGDLRQVLYTALADTRARRFADAKTFLQALERVLAQGQSEQTAMETLAVSVSELLPERPVRHESFGWTEELLHKLEIELATYTGPVAGILIKKSSATSQSPMELVESLARHIHDVKERESFLSKAKHCMATGSCHGTGSQSGARSRSTLPLADTLTPEQVTRLARVLAGHVGPIARQLVNHHARRTYQLDELHHQLANSIPNSLERQAFLNQVRR